jgi:hypothetical protein
MATITYGCKSYNTALIFIQPAESGFCEKGDESHLKFMQKKVKLSCLVGKPRIFR